MKENKYEFSEENPEDKEISEPAIAYQKNSTLNPPCQYSIEELREKFDRAVKQVEAGEVLTHEEVKNRYKKL